MLNTQLSERETRKTQTQYSNSRSLKIQLANNSSTTLQPRTSIQQNKTQLTQQRLQNSLNSKKQQLANCNSDATKLALLGSNEKQGRLLYVADVGDMAQIVVIVRRMDGSNLKPSNLLR